MSQIFHSLLALIASATDRELSKYVEYLKEENKILRARIPGQIHTRREEKPAIVMHDLDTKFTKEFTARLKSRACEPNHCRRPAQT